MDNNKKNGFEWFASGNAPVLFPTELVTGGFLFEDLTKVDIPESCPFGTIWGKPVSMHILPNNHHPAPKFILIIWFSIVESKFYTVANELPTEIIESLLAEKNEKTNEPKYNTLVAGMAPYGQLAIWLAGSEIITQVAWLQGKELQAEMQEFFPESKLSKEEYAKEMLAECRAAYDNFKKNGLPNTILFEKYMQKFNYKITSKFENAQFENIEIDYYNGETNTLHTGEHATSAMRAKPYKIILTWNVGKKQYAGYFWMDAQKITEIFANHYNNDSEKEVNLIIEVKESNKQFKFFLQDDTKMTEIPEEDLQVIVFKNKFEFFRSKNYNKPPQGWRN